MMTNAERRDSGMVYLGDEQVFSEMAECKKKLKKLNETDVFGLLQIQASFGSQSTLLLLTGCVANIPNVCRQKKLKINI